MPKQKTKSGAKKRFKMTGTGKVIAAAQGKRHGMIKRTAKFVRTARGTMVLNDSDAKIVKKYMPYNRRRTREWSVVRGEWRHRPPLRTAAHH